MNDQIFSDVLKTAVGNTPWAGLALWMLHRWFQERAEDRTNSREERKAYLDTLGALKASVEGLKIAVERLHDLSPTFVCQNFKVGSRQ